MEKNTGGMKEHALAAKVSRMKTVFEFLFIYGPTLWTCYEIENSGSSLPEPFTVDSLVSRAPGNISLRPSACGNARILPSE